MYLRDSPIDELPPKSRINDLKMNIDKKQETVNNYQRYILGYTGKFMNVLFIVKRIKLHKILSNYLLLMYVNYRIYTWDAFSVWQNFL